MKLVMTTLDVQQGEEMLAPSLFASIKWEMPGEMLQYSAPSDLSATELHPAAAPVL